MKDGHYANMFKLPGHFQNYLSGSKDQDQFRKNYSTLTSATTWGLHYESFAGITGHVMVYVIFFMFTTAAKLVRKLKFEIFIHTHHLYVIFYICLFLHSFGCLFHSPDGQCKGYNTKYYITPAFFIFLLDRLIRVWRSREDTNISDVILHPGKVIEIRFEKFSMNYNPGQYLYVNIPEISKFQWHPFTISSTPQEGFSSIHVKVVGDWTNALYDLVSKENSEKGENVGFPSIRIDGPYGAPAQDLFTHKTSVLISAGIGVTPSAGLLKAIWYAYMRKAPMKLEKLHLIWVCRDMQDIAWFQSLLYYLEEHVPESFVQSRIFLTGKMGVESLTNIMLNDSKDFDPITQLKSKTLIGRPQLYKE
jgi:NADPH oxidase